MFLNTVESSNFMVFIVTFFFFKLFCSPYNSCPVVLTLQKIFCFIVVSQSGSTIHPSLINQSGRLRPTFMETIVGSVPEDYRLVLVVLVVLVTNVLKLFFSVTVKSLPQRTTPEKMFHLGRLQPYSQTLDQAGKACQEQTLQLIAKKSSTTEKKSFITLTPGCGPTRGGWCSGPRSCWGGCTFGSGSPKRTKNTQSCICSCKELSEAA